MCLARNCPALIPSVSRHRQALLQHHLWKQGESLKCCGSPGQLSHHSGIQKAPATTSLGSLSTRYRLRDRNQQPQSPAWHSTSKLGWNCDQAVLDKRFSVELISAHGIGGRKQEGWKSRALQILSSVLMLLDCWEHSHSHNSDSKQLQIQTPSAVHIFTFRTLLLEPSPEPKVIEVR